MRGRKALGAALAATLLAAIVQIAEVRADSAPPADSVIAVIDTGINPYHESFRDDSRRALQHPSTYIPGYPGDATALHLTFGPDYWDSVSADCERVWSTIQPGRLYWVPGTRIVGAVAFGIQGELDCDQSKPHAHGIILDSYGHGTMVASRAAANQYGACPQCLVVAVEGFSSESIAWAAANSRWIDAQSNSWGPFMPAWEPAGLAPGITSNPGFVRAVEASSRAHPSFWASGNGALTRFGGVGHPTALEPRLTPSAIIVGGHDSGYVTAWPGFSAHVVADSCAARAAQHDHAWRSGDRISGGTSGATPFAAGIAMEQLREARRILGSSGTGVRDGVVARGPAGLVPGGPIADGVFTAEEWKRLLFVTATARPARQPHDGPPCGPLAAPYNETPVRWVDVPPQYPEYVQIGYGAADWPALALARRVLRGEVPAPARPETDRFFATDRQIRTTTYGVFSKP